MFYVGLVPCAYVSSIYSAWLPGFTWVTSNPSKHVEPNILGGRWVYVGSLGSCNGC